jgi:hypothetical protein
MVDPTHDWPSSSDAGWEAHRIAQRRRLARFPLAEKLAWLEDAQRVVDYLRSQRAKAGSEPHRQD